MRMQSAMMKHCVGVACGVMMLAVAHARWIVDGMWLLKLTMLTCCVETYHDEYVER